MKAAAAGLGALLLVPVLLLAALGAALSGWASDPGGAALTCLPAGAPAALEGYDSDQIANAATIVAVGEQMNVPAQGQVVAVATALQESGLRNLTYGDRDSLGLFQQRPSQGWGTAAQVTDPTYAAAAFYRGLLAVPGWQQLSLTTAAQAVQRSAFPNAYAKHEPAATTLTAAVGGAACIAPTPPTATAARAVAFAHAQLGQPYVWGGDGGAEGGFDCSGLTAAAYGAAGIALPRTADAQFRAGPAVPDGQPLVPGDLIFYGTPARVTHVAIYVGSGRVINAPTFGQPVREQSARYPGDRYVGVTRPTAVRV